jgi:hypothetical protein
MAVEELLKRTTFSLALKYHAWHNQVAVAALEAVLTRRIWSAEATVSKVIAVEFLTPEPTLREISCACSAAFALFMT